MLTFDLNRMSEEQRNEVLGRGGVDLADAMSVARPVIDAVRARGDAALREYAARFDSFAGGPLTLPVSAIEAGARATDRRVISALKASKKRIEAFHRRQVLRPFSYRDECGSLGQRVVPLRRVGVYVPGGSADYMSSVLMACIPASIAGVEEMALCTPGRTGKVPGPILAVANMCGVKEIHPVGGAQAIAAMAYGTASIPKVQKIVGPGGAVVSAAKLLVRNDCEIDFLAGPSEVLVIADELADPELVASDMLAQLEHDALARAVLVTTSRDLLEKSKAELSRQIERTGRSEIARTAAERGAVFVLAGDLDSAIEFSNDYAPEHLLIDVRRPERVLDRIESAGSVFLGRYSTVAFGDYCSGTNHILPTKGAAAMRSSLSVYDFLKVIPFQNISAKGAAKLSSIVDTLARSEGLPAHADAALMRARKVRK